jgi:hypothetical protein
MKPSKTQVGDLFQIPISKTRFVCGQVLFINHVTFPLYIVVFKPAYEFDQLPDIDIICESEIALVGGTMDARIHHGDWTIIGNTAPIIHRIPKPYFKVDIKGKLSIENFFGKFVRKATPEDLELYDNWTTFSPMTYESAIKSVHGEADWLPAYDQLLFEYSLERSV